MSHEHSHSDDHHHNHASEVTDRDSQRRVMVAMCLIGCFMLIEVVGGIYSQSLALLSDAGHMFSDFFALLMAWMAFRLSHKKPDLQRSYGYHRFQVLAAFINALMLIVIALWIFIVAIKRFFQPVEVFAGSMLTVAVIGLIINIVVYWYLSQGDRENLNMKGAALHVLADLLGSVAAIVAAVIIMTTGWMQADPLLSVIAAMLIVKSAWRVVKESGHILLEGTPQSVEPELLRKDLELAVPEIRNIHHVHIWCLTGSRPVLTMHADVDDNVDHNKIQDRIQQTLKDKFGIAHATVQLECERCQSNNC